MRSFERRDFGLRSWLIAGRTGPSGCARVVGSCKSCLWRESGAGVVNEKDKRERRKETRNNEKIRDSEELSRRRQTETQVAVCLQHTQFPRRHIETPSGFPTLPLIKYNVRLVLAAVRNDGRALSNMAQGRYRRYCY